MDVLIAGPQENPATLANLCRNGFDSLGHEVRIFDTHTMTIPVLGYDVGVDTIRREFVEVAKERDPDIILVITGDVFAESDLKEIRANTDAVLCNWNPDNPFMARSHDRRMDNYLELLPLYDIAFIWTESLFDSLSEAGARTVKHLPFAYDPSVHRDVGYDPRHESDVVFAGHWSKKRQRHLAAVAELDVDLAIYGNYWKRKCFDRGLRRCIRDSAVIGEEYSKVHCSSKVPINIVADHNLDAYNMRTFEIPATGSFMVTSRTEKQDDLLGENEGMVCFDSPEELSEKVAEYLNDGRRAEIAKKGAELIRSHTYENRMETVVESVEEVQ